MDLNFHDLLVKYYQNSSPEVSISITHLPSGIRVEGSTTTSTIKLRDELMDILKAKLKELS